jgi:hypothetical protein
MQMRRSSSAMTAAVAVVAVGGLSACGRVDPDDKPSGSRPPAQIMVSAAITDDGVTLSPSRVGAGPVRILISNQTSSELRTTLRDRDRDEAGARATKPIGPGGVAAIQAVVRPNRTYRITTTGDSPVSAATLRVGKERKSSDDELLLP